MGERRQIKVWLFGAKLFTANVGPAAVRLDYLITSWNQRPICQNIFASKYQIRIGGLFAYISKKNSREFEVMLRD